MFRTSLSIHPITTVLIVTAGYMMFGAISMLAAIPPGYATAVWPAAGVALLGALVLGPAAYLGVFIGATALNYGISVNYDQTEPSILISTCMGAFATLQSLAGRFLIVSMIPAPIQFSRASTVAKFIVLGGAVSPLINATISNIFLWSQGILDGSAWFKNWVSWYVGDAIGIIFIVPWLLVFLPKTLSSRASKARFVLNSLITVTVCSALLGYLITNTEKQKHYDEFSVNASILERSLASHLSRAADILQALAGFVRIQEDLTPAEYRAFTTELLDRNPAIHGLSWDERLRSAELENYQKDMTQRYAAFNRSINFTIEALADTSVTQNNMHVIVSYIEPMADNLRALGVDVYSDTTRQGALDNAWKEQALYPTAPLQLIQGEDAQPGVLLFLPAQQIAQSLHSGYATAILKVQQMIANAFQKVLLEKSSVVVFDPEVLNGKGTLFRHNISDEALHTIYSEWSTDEGENRQLLDTHYSLFEQRKIEVGARNWVMLQLSESQFLYQPWGVHLLLAGTVLFAGLLGWFVIIVAGHTDEIEFQVERRTHDLTEANRRLQASETAQAEAVRAAQQSNRAKSEFLANMSHEIRTPLNAILGLSRLGLTQHPKPGLRDKFAKINHSGELLLAIINDILDFSKIEARKLELESRIFSLKDIINQLQDLFQAQAEGKGITLSFRFEGKVSPWLKGDSLRLRQVLANLLSNAVKFTYKGSVTLTCQMQKINESQCLLMVTVNDTGIGMSANQLSVIFDAFTQADSSTSRKYGGTGLGMAISQRLVTAMGGEIEVKSEDGLGSCFSVSLPFDVPSAETVKAFKEKVRQTEFDEAKPVSGHILLVEDNQINQEVVGEQLKHMGLKVSFADNGALAVLATRELTYDLILMDIQMPVMDGYEATRQMRAAGVTTPIVALTAAAMVEDMRKALECGMNDHLSKPFRQEDMLRVFQKWLPVNEA